MRKVKNTHLLVLSSSEIPWVVYVVLFKLFGVVEDMLFYFIIDKTKRRNTNGSTVSVRGLVRCGRLDGSSGGVGGLTEEERGGVTGDFLLLFPFKGIKGGWEMRRQGVCGRWKGQSFGRSRENRTMGRGGSWGDGDGDGISPRIKKPPFFLLVATINLSFSRSGAPRVKPKRRKRRKTGGGGRRGKGRSLWQER